MCIRIKIPKMDFIYLKIWCNGVIFFVRGDIFFYSPCSSPKTTGTKQNPPGHKYAYFYHLNVLRLNYHIFLKIRYLGGLWGPYFRYNTLEEKEMQLWMHNVTLCCNCKIIQRYKQTLWKNWSMKLTGFLGILHSGGVVQYLHNDLLPAFIMCNIWEHHTAILVLVNGVQTGRSNLSISILTLYNCSHVYNWCKAMHSTFTPLYQYAHPTLWLHTL